MIRDRLRRIVTWLFPSAAPACPDLSGGPGPEIGELPSWAYGNPNITDADHQAMAAEMRRRLSDVFEIPEEWLVQPEAAAGAQLSVEDLMERRRQLDAAGLPRPG